MKGFNLSINGRLWLFAAACMAIIAYMGYNFYDTEYTAYSEKVEKLDGDIRKKKGELRQILAQKQRLKDLEAEIEMANAEFAKLQGDFTRQSFDAMVAHGSRSAEAMLKLAGEIAQPFSSRLAVAADKFKVAA